MNEHIAGVYSMVFSLSLSLYSFLSSLLKIGGFLREVVRGVYDIT